MKKLSLWLCPVALVALGTSARAGNYQSVPANGNGPGFPETYYAGPSVAPAVSAFAPRIDPANPTGPMLPQDQQTSNSREAGLSQKTWVWYPTPGYNDPARSERFISSYSLACNLSGVASPTVHGATGSSYFTVSGDINEQFYYYQGMATGTPFSRLPPPSPDGQPITQWTLYSSSTYQSPYMRADGKSCIRVQASAAVPYNDALVNGAYPPGSGQANAGQASIQIKDFDCADAHLGGP